MSGRSEACNLVFQGVLNRDLLELIMAADATRDRIAHDRPPPPSVAEFEELLTLVERLRQEVAEPALG